MTRNEVETNLIADFQMLDESVIYLHPQTEEVAQIANAVGDPELWEKWIDSSGKDAPPPDFYSDELCLMMEVMRIDDHGYRKKGKTVNPVYERERQLERELRATGIFDRYPNAELVVTAKSGLPTEEDHNYSRYVANFRGAIEKHGKKISNYRKNHPNHKLIFFVYDESSLYFESDGEFDRSAAMLSGYLHWHMHDKAFVDVLKDYDIDYLIWYTPYKWVEHSFPPVIFPRAFVYKNGIPMPEEITYNADKMVSSEK